MFKKWTFNSKLSLLAAAVGPEYRWNYYSPMDYFNLSSLKTLTLFHKNSQLPRSHFQSKLKDKTQKQTSWHFGFTITYQWRVQNRYNYNVELFFDIKSSNRFYVRSIHDPFTCVAPVNNSTCVCKFNFEFSSLPEASEKFSLGKFCPFWARIIQCKHDEILLIQNIHIWFQS